LFVVIDTLRADYLGCYGGNAKTPNLDKLSERSIKFKNAFSASDFTAPSFLSIFSGLYPSEHGMINWSKKSKTLPLLENLKSNGYKVQGFTNFKFIKQLLQSSMKIDFIGEDFGKYWDINQHLQVTERTIRYLEENKNNNFFLFYHHSAPHAPYRFPKPELNKILKDKEFTKYYSNLMSDELIQAIFPQIKNKEINQIFKNDQEAIKQSSLIAKVTTGMIHLNQDQAELIKFLYKKEVEWTDNLFGKILNKLEELKLINHTIICFLADHGELLYEQGKFGHANDFMLNEVLNIPCLLYIPSLKENRIVENNISHVNILPTVLEIANLKLDERSNVRSMWNEISKNQPIKPKPVYSEGNFRVLVIKDNIKYITDSKRKTQIIGIKDFINNLIHMIKTNTFSIYTFKNNLMLFLVPFFKRFMGIPKEEMYKIIIKNNIKIQVPIKNKTIKKEMSKLIDDYYSMKRSDLTEDLTEEELEIIKVRLEALGYLDKK